MKKEKIILYSNNCPCCKVLKTKLDEKKIGYELCSDVSAMLELGIKSVPMLSVNGQLLNYKESLVWAEKGN